MIHYKDTTFCTAKDCLAFDDCPRALTEQVKADAQRWWGTTEAPIARFIEPENLECYDPREMDK